MADPKIYRKRIIPEECLLLGDDVILYQDEDKIVTKWNTLRPKKEFSRGYSCYFLKEGYKISKFIKSDGNLLYWYCDIIDYEYDESDNAYTFRDLLVDVIVYPDDFVKVDDMDELAEAMRSGAIGPDDVPKALESLNTLLKLIYDGKFTMITREIEGLVVTA